MYPLFNQIITSLNYLIIFIAITINFLPNLNINFVQDINQSILGGIVGYSSIWIIIYIYRKIRKAEGMGLGDAKLMAGVGLLFGWQSVFIILFFSSVIALLVILPFLINKKKNLKSKIPFGPYIIISGILYFCYGINFLTLF